MGGLAMPVSHRKRFGLLLLGVFLLSATSAMAELVTREKDIVGLRLGQHVMVDDGSCPAGEIKEVLGAKMTPSGIVAVRKCIPRLGPKKR
jgi:hypothetical protein